MTVDTLTDHSPAIRAQIERDVLALKATLEAPGRWLDTDQPLDPVKAQYVELGFLVNSHQGEAVYADGDVVAWLPVRINRDHPRVIRVYAGRVRFMETYSVWDDENERYHEEQRPYTRDLSEQTIW